MPQHAIVALQGLLSPHVSLGKSRLETLCLIVVGMVSARTVNLSHLAAERPGSTLIASTYRRLQRFFQHVQLGPDWAAPLIGRMLRGARSWDLALDRTQWQVGGRDINYLVLAVITPRYRVPILWSVLEGRGNSSTAARIALMRRYLALFGAGSIRMLLADREVIGADWMKFLNKNNIPFAIRLREDMRAITSSRTGKSHDLTLAARLRGCQRTRRFTARLGRPDGPEVEINAKRLSAGEWLIVASNRPGREPYLAYRKRWAVECLFGDAKTRGLNIEDTRLTNPEKLDLLMGLVALALAWAGRTATDLLAPNVPKRKAHGHYAKSWFRIGFDRIRQLLRTDPPEAVKPWQRITPNKPKSPRVV